MNRAGRLLLGSVILLGFLGWAGHVATTTHTANAHPLWILRQELLNLSGLLAIGMMSLAVFMAARPAWLERPLHGLDQMYRLHKWAGIWAGILALGHWLMKEVVGDILKASIGRAGKPPKETILATLEPARDLAKDVGEWGFYILLAMLALALWQRFPYRPWRLLHRAMPILYLALVFHAVMWAPSTYWRQPLGLLLALLFGFGIYGSVLALKGAIGRRRRVVGSIAAIEQPMPGVVSVRCRLADGWPGHRPGQFVFVTFDAGEGAHPFTIASADRGDRSIDLSIKALGDYTRGLADRLQVGQAVQVEGPYGRFQLDRVNRKTRQIWIAGGIGITPFLAWLDSLQQQPSQAPTAELHYCTRDREGDPFVARLEALCANLPMVRLRVHGDKQGEMLDAGQLRLTDAERARQRTEIWFCGPSGLAEKLQRELAALRRTDVGVSFRQEAFAMR
ncbi:Ferric reductase domain protein protein transmembrane component domain protein [Sterolibacterium denitrificans]|uniref:Ferric reductase domain protein protein transmembrane component domain protein n=1 Tax=Sterolibacterium denitrificans TaxID=157592 RepID=A0A7Z7HPE8_9PROT|nr:ferric reductase-like transmembrane domain-containing protein [Sterolibacterium denitrificans]SMB22625.1 Ferric reductase domain protein protein transmembrane component domain protein [Sterolibacterium denitrificans]